MFFQVLQYFPQTKHTLNPTVNPTAQEHPAAGAPYALAERAGMRLYYTVAERRVVPLPDCHRRRRPFGWPGLSRDRLTNTATGAARSVSDPPSRQPPI